MLKVKIQGAFLIVLGLLFMHQSLDLRWGTLTNLGPGFWPTILSSMLVILGSLVAWLGNTNLKDEKLRLPAIVTVLVGMLIYAMVITKFALIFTAVLVLMISLAARHDSVSIKTVISAGILLSCVIAFLRIIGIDTPLWPILQ